MVKCCICMNTRKVTYEEEIMRCPVCQDILRLAGEKHELEETKPERRQP